VNRLSLHYSAPFHLVNATEIRSKGHGYIHKAATRQNHVFRVLKDVTTLIKLLRGKSF